MRPHIPVPHCGRILTLIAALLLSAVAPSAAQRLSGVASRLRADVEYYAGDNLAGRLCGSEGEALAARRLRDAFSEAGAVLLSPESGDEFTIEATSGAITSRNVVAVVEGAAPSLRGEYIVVGANLDHLGTRPLTVDGVQVQQIYRGADCNASSLAIMAELARMVAASSLEFDRSIVFVGFGASEQGRAGSWYFLNRSFPFPDSVRAMVSLDMLGRSGSSNPFSLYTSFPRAEIMPVVKMCGKEGVAITPKVTDGMVRPGDHLPFHERSIPFILFTTGTHRDWQTPKDVPESLSYSNMEDICGYLFHFLRRMASDLSPIRPAATVTATAAGRDGIYSPAECDKRPEFFRSDELHFLRNWVYKYLKYPQEAVSEGIQGTVDVAFIIEKDGNVSNVEVVRGVSEELDAEAVRVVAASPKWKPGKVAGRAVRTRVVIPVEFRLRRVK